MDEPRLRSVDKISPPYPLGKFPKDTLLRIAGGIVYLLYTRGEARLEGQDWEQIFAKGIKAEWRPSNVGLDDVQLDSCCWGAKTIKHRKPSQASKIRLISGRNSLDYSYKQSDSRGLSEQEIGNHVLQIWNSRVSLVRQRFAHCRTVVLIKGDKLSECAIFEFETLRFEPELFSWKWNKNGNLVGADRLGQHKFTWQPHGSQFTIIEDVPENRIAFKLRVPEGLLPQEDALKAMGFNETWIEIL